jgi:uncharacterized protein DUF4404
MEEKNLSQLLEELHDELAKTKAVDDKGRELLRHLKTDIQTLLKDEEPNADESLLERLEDSVEHFEEAYPNLTSMLSNLINALNNAGI